MGKLALAAKITHVPSMYLCRSFPARTSVAAKPRSTATRRSAKKGDLFDADYRRLGRFEFRFV